MNPRVLVAIVVAIALTAATCSSSSEDSATILAASDDPRATIESYIEAYNNGDFDEVMTHFTEESVIVGHPTDSDPEAADIYSIRTLHKQDLSFKQEYRISNVEADGDTVTWNSVWGEDGCVKGHTAVIRDGKILSWIWGDFVECSDLE